MDPSSTLTQTNVYGGCNGRTIMSLAVFGGLFVVAIVLVMIYRLLREINLHLSDINYKIGKIGVRQITSSIRLDDGCMKLSADTTPEISEMLRLLRQVADGKH